MHTKKPDPYNGTLIKRTTQRKEEADEKENKEGEYKLTLRATEKELREEEAVVEGRRNEGENAHTLRVKEGVRKILHYRNLYAFLGHVAEDLI